MGAYKYLEEIAKRKQSDAMRFLMRVRCWEYRQLPSIHRLTRPTRVDKARRLGFKATQGFCVYRVRIVRGDRKVPVRKGHVWSKPKNHGVMKIKSVRSLRARAEERVGRRCAGLRVLNSYWVNSDSQYSYYEVIMVDPAHKAIRRNPRINWICDPVHRSRENRGLTGAGRKSRGMLSKGHGAHHIRPSRRAMWKRINKQEFHRYR
eukprot:a174493_16549.p1 GENE.a174493_16549~~a174493_16549.p1  ORF type:complete len:214 (+),score=69.28 a174493_16549:30-644(+)